MSEDISLPPSMDENYQSISILLQSSTPRSENNSFEEVVNETPQHNKFFDLDLDPKSRNIRADLFGSEASSSEGSFDDIHFDTASVNSQLSALDELEELEMDYCSTPLSVGSFQEKEINSANEIPSTLVTENEEQTILQQLENHTTNVHVSLKNEHKTSTKTGHVRCRVPSRENSFKTRNSSCSVSTNSLASETGSESSATFYGPGEKCHEVRVQRVSLTSLPGLDMPDFIKASMEASLEKMELRNDKEEEEMRKYEDNYKGAIVTNESPAKSLPSLDDTKSSTIRAKFRKKFTKTAKQQPKRQQSGTTEIKQRKEKSGQSSRKKSPATQIQGKELEMRPKRSKAQKANLENIKITESQIVMVVTNDQKSTSLNPQSPVLKRDEAQTSPSKEEVLVVESILSPNEPKHETLNSFTPKKDSSKHVQNEKCETAVNTEQSEDSSLNEETAVLTNAEENRFPSILNNQSTGSTIFEASSNSEKYNNQNGMSINSSEDEKTNISLPMTQLSTEKTPSEEEFAELEKSVVASELQETIIEKKTLLDSGKLDIPLYTIEDDATLRPETQETKSISPSEKETNIPLPFRNDEFRDSSGEKFLSNEDSHNQKLREMPIPSKIAHHEGKEYSLSVHETNSEQTPGIGGLTASDDEFVELEKSVIASEVQETVIKTKTLLDPGKPDIPLYPNEYNANIGPEIRQINPTSPNEKKTKITLSLRSDESLDSTGDKLLSNEDSQNQKLSEIPLPLKAAHREGKEYCLSVDETNSEQTLSIGGLTASDDEFVELEKSVIASDVQETVIETKTLLDPGKPDIPLYPNEDNATIGPEIREINQTSPSKKKTKIPLPPRNDTSRDSSGGKGLPNKDSQNQKLSEIPLPLKAAHHEGREYSLSLDETNSESTPSIGGLTAKEDGKGWNNRQENEPTPSIAPSPKGKSSKIPVLSKSEQSQCETSLANGKDPSNNQYGSVAMKGESLHMSFTSSSEEKRDESASTVEQKDKSFSTTGSAPKNVNNMFSPKDKKSKIPIFNKGLINTSSVAEDSDAQLLLDLENNNVQYLETEVKTFAHNDGKTTSPVTEEEEQLFAKDSQISTPVERRSRIPVPTNEQRNKNISFENDDQKLKKSPVSSPVEKKSTIPQSRIPLPRNSAVKLSSSVEDKTYVWIKNEKGYTEEDSCALHSPLATSTPAKKSSEPSKLPVATSRMQATNNKGEEIVDVYDEDDEDGRQTLLQRYMMSEDRRVKEIFRYQTSNTKL